MKAARWWLAAAAAAALAAAVLAASTGRGGVGASSLSRGPLGLWTAAAYLEARGATVVRRDAPLSARRPAGTLVLAFPAGSPFAPEEAVALRRHLREGGAVVLAYSGGSPGPAEVQAADELGVELEEVRRDPPLWPPAWWRFERAEWRLAAGDGKAVRPVAMRAPRYLPVRGGECAVFLRGPAGEAVGFSFPLRHGLVVVLPAETLANCRLGEPGAADILEGLAGVLPGRWELDEWRHGLRPATAPARWRGSLAFDLLLVQIALVYGAMVWMLGRPLGRPWREQAVAQGSVAAFLIALGRLHDRMRHHREAGRALVQRASELDAEVGKRLGAVEAAAADGPGLMALAARVAAAQRWRSEKGRCDE